MSLTDTQLVLLSSASQREDHLVTLPSNLKGGAAKKVVEKLLGLGLVKEVSVKRDQPVWRTDENERPVGLKITRAGLKALGLGSPRRGSARARHRASEQLALRAHPTGAPGPARNRPSSSRS